MPDLVKNHIGMIKSIPGGFNGSIGYLYPNDPDGTVFAQIFDPEFKKAGWKPVDPGRFQQGLPDFSAIINQFKRNRVQVVTGVLAPPDLQNYLQQAAQAGFRPRMYIIDKGTGYPEPMKAIGKNGENILSVNFWSPAFPGRVQVQRARRRAAGRQPTRRNSKSSTRRRWRTSMRSTTSCSTPCSAPGPRTKSALLKALKDQTSKPSSARSSSMTSTTRCTPLGGAQWHREGRKAGEGECLQ